jgi:deazaflavin-dependent oxidoreductase (nitroreductase family)
MPGKPIPPIDPTAKKSAVLRRLEDFVASDIGKKFYIATVAKIEPHVIDATHGKVQFGGGPRVNVKTIGRKSGEPRVATLLYFTEGETVVIIASSFGRDGHPAWYLNLKAQPEVTLEWRGGSGKYVAEEVGEPERTRLFELASLMYTGYAKYQAGTDRKIPVVVLKPVAK